MFYDIEPILRMCYILNYADKIKYKAIHTSCPCFFLEYMILLYRRLFFLGIIISARRRSSAVCLCVRFCTSSTSTFPASTDIVDALASCKHKTTDDGIAVKLISTCKSYYKFDDFLSNMVQVVNAKRVLFASLVKNTKNWGQENSLNLLLVLHITEYGKKNKKTQNRFWMEFLYHWTLSHLLLYMYGCSSKMVVETKVDEATTSSTRSTP